MRRPTLLYGLARTAVAMALALEPLTVRAQTTPNKRTAPHEPPPEVRRLTIAGASHADVVDLEQNIATQATTCSSILLVPICAFSHSPTIQYRYYLNETEFQRDVLRIRLYYWLRGYRDATVDTSVVKTGPRQVNVTFTIHENEPTVIRSLAITADSNLVNGRARGRIFGMLHEKDPLDLVRIDSLRASLQRIAWNAGHGDAVVDTSIVVDDSARIADVAITLVPKHVTTIGPISVTGTRLVRQDVVLRALAFRTGDLYRQTTLLESQRNLYESSLFKFAQIQVPPQLDSVKSVNIDVSEAPLHEVRAGPGIDNVDFAQFTAQYTAFNLLGGARRLDVSATAGNLLASSLSGHGIFRDVAAYVPDSQSVSPFLQPTFNASIDLKQPSFLRRSSNTASIGVFTHRTINPGVFIDKGYGGQVTFTNEIAIRAPVSINYRYEINRVEASDVYFCVNYGVCDPSTINTLRTHQALSPLVLTGYVDRSNIPLGPTRGYTARLDFETASQFTGSDYRYNRAFLDAAVYSGRRRTGHVFSAHVRSGWVAALRGGDVSGVIHPRKRFYAGGANSVRGYAENQLGPRILTIDASTLVANATSIGGGTCGRTLATIVFCDPNSSKLSRADFIAQPLGGTTLFEGSVEYRFPFPGNGTWADQFSGAVFLDGATVGHADIGNVPLISSRVNGTAAVTPGFGVRYSSPIGPVRMDLGLNPNRAEDLAVVTAVPDGAGQTRIVPLPRAHNFTQASNFLGRFVFHISIGEAY
jgi:outer membrane protein assembly factor BamA